MADLGTSGMVAIKTGKIVPRSATIVGEPVFSDRLDDVEGLSAKALERHGFKGATDDLLVLADESQTRVLLGVGASDSIDPQTFRRVAAMFVRRADRHAKAGFDLGPTLDVVEGSEAGAETSVAVVGAVSEGLLLGSYSFTEYKKPADGVAGSSTVTVAVGERAGKLAKAMTPARSIAGAVGFARDLVNEPGGTLTPSEFAKRASERAKEAGLQVQVMDEKAIAKARLGGLLAVNQGSSEPPRLLKLTYTPEGVKSSTKPTLCLVGKGITFDSGGLSLKPADSMIGMKNDMAGAAAVIATMCALPALGVEHKVVSFTPMTDNMTGGAAQRPGDIYTARNGKTVEVLNTDAEGRLVLGEALVLASEQKPAAIVDLATLTGACVVALGEKIAGLMSNDDDLTSRIESAAKSSGERVWHLPLPEDYRKGLDSKIADLKNIGPRWGGTLTAGLFLREFVGDDIKWAHLDIAGPATTDEVDGENGVGATGFGVRTLLELIRNW